MQRGIDILTEAEKTGNIGKLILISDGLANQGITDPVALGNMAGTSVEMEFGLSTIGVGIDYNEQLMTMLADRGTGNYHFLDDPARFAQVFEKEFNCARAVAATSVKVKIPVQNGVSVVDVAGFPFQTENNNVIFYPGDLLSGQERKLFVTLKLPTDKECNIDLGSISAEYMNKGKHCVDTIDEHLRIARVRDRQQGSASIEKKEREDKITQEEYSKLKEQVAYDIKGGKKDEAMAKIQKYYDDVSVVNSAVGSAEVSQNLDQELGDLREAVEETFVGTPSAVQEKQKAASKAIQYEGYSVRRSK